MAAPRSTMSRIALGGKCWPWLGQINGHTSPSVSRVPKKREGTLRENWEHRPSFAAG